MWVLPGGLTWALFLLVVSVEPLSVEVLPVEVRPVAPRWPPPPLSGPAPGSPRAVPGDGWGHDDGSQRSYDATAHDGWSSTPKHGSGRNAVNDDGTTRADDDAAGDALWVPAAGNGGHGRAAAATAAPGRASRGGVSARDDAGTAIHGGTGTGTGTRTGTGTGTVNERIYDL